MRRSVGIHLHLQARKQSKTTVPCIMYILQVGWTSDFPSVKSPNHAIVIRLNWNSFTVASEGWYKASHGVQAWKCRTSWLVTGSSILRLAACTLQAYFFPAHISAAPISGQHTVDHPMYKLITNSIWRNPLRKVPYNPSLIRGIYTKQLLHFRLCTTGKYIQIIPVLAIMVWDFLV